MKVSSNMQKIVVLIVLLVINVACNIDNKEISDVDGREQLMQVLSMKTNPKYDDSLPGRERCKADGLCFGKSEAVTASEQWETLNHTLGLASAFTLHNHLLQYTRVPEHLIEDPTLTTNKEWIRIIRKERNLKPLPHFKNADDNETFHSAVFVLTEMAETWPVIFKAHPDNLIKEITLHRVRRSAERITVEFHQNIKGLTVDHGPTIVMFDENWLPIAITNWFLNSDSIKTWLDDIGGALPPSSNALAYLEEFLLEETGEFSLDAVFEIVPIWHAQYQRDGYRIGISTSNYPNGEYFFVSPTRLRPE